MSAGIWSFSHLARCLSLAGILLAGPLAAQSGSATIQVSATIVRAETVAPVVQAALRLADLPRIRAGEARPVTVERDGTRVSVRTEAASTDRPRRRTVTVAWVGT